MSHFLMPVLALMVWTFAMWTLMYWRRIPAMTAVNRDTQEFIRQPDLMSRLPARVRWAADNYNHLHEQPTIFYALMLVLFVTGQLNAPNLYLAWAYVVIRVVHSLLQVTSNRVLLRFGVFVVASLALMALTARCIAGLLQIAS